MRRALSPCATSSWFGYRRWKLVCPLGSCQVFRRFAKVNTRRRNALWYLLRSENIFCEENSELTVGRKPFQSFQTFKRFASFKTFCRKPVPCLQRSRDD